MEHTELIKLVVAYTLVGALIFTVIATCLSMVGIIKFADKSQQNKLFQVLVLELVVGSLAFFFGFIKLDAAEVAEEITLKTEQEVGQKLATAMFGKESESLPAEATIKLSNTSALDHYRVAIDGVPIDLTDGQATIGVKPGESVVSWFASGEPLSEQELTISQGENVLYTKKFKIGPNTRIGAGSNLAEIEF